MNSCVIRLSNGYTAHAKYDFHVHAFNVTVKSPNGKICDRRNFQTIVPDIKELFSMLEQYSAIRTERIVGEIGLGTSIMNGTEQTVADENTVPVGITFVAGANKAGGVALGDIPVGQHRAVWNAAAAAASDGFTMRVEGDTAP